MGFALLGSVHFVLQGETVEIGRRQEKCLLCVLLLEAGRVVPAERLLDLLWNGDPPSAARATLHTYVARLRKSLEPHNVSLVRRGGGYLVDVDAKSVDVHRFSGAVSRAATLPQPAQRLAVLGEALALWRGPLMADVADDWLRDRLAPQLERKRLTALEMLAEALLDLGRLDEAADQLANLVAGQPDRERPVELLMQALFRSGRKADALTAFRELRHRLVEQHGLEPGASLQTLHRRILNDDRTLLPAEAPQRLAGRNFLPRDLPDFTGREPELTWLDEAAEASGGTVLISAIAGMGGVGKTALAVRWAHRVAARYPDGQLYLNLRGADERHPLPVIEALSQLLRVLEVNPLHIPADPDHAATLYRSLLADRKMLILLDNAGSAEQVRPLLPSGEGNLVVVTSRDQLAGLIARDGARRLTLDTLTPAESVRLLAQIVGERRVAAEPEAAAALGAAVGHLPLAVRIAAANLAGHPGRSLASYVAELAEHDRLSALAVPGDPASAVRAVFHHSVLGLAEPEQRLFGLLGLVPGPDFALSGAAALAGVATAQARPLLDTLLAAHLVTELRPGRYQMHELVKLYAAELAGPQPQALARLHDYYLDWTDAAARIVQPQMLRLAYTPVGEGPAFADEAEALDWLDGERAALLAAIHLAAAQRDNPAGWRLNDMLRGYLYRRQLMPEWVAAGQVALESAMAQGNVEGEIVARFSVAHGVWNQADQARATEAMLPVVELAGRIGWHAALAGALGNLGGIHCDWGQPEQAAKYLQAALEVHRQHPVAPGVAGLNLSHLGASCHDLGQLAEAADHHREAIALLDSINAPIHSATARLNLGTTLLDSGEPAEAAKQFEAAYATLGSVTDQRTRAALLAEDARCRLALGEVEAAAALATEALTQGREINAPRIIASSLTTLGVIEGDPARHDEALTKVTFTGHLTTQVLLAQCLTLTRLGRHREAMRRGFEALELAQEEGFAALEGVAHARLAELADAIGNQSDATEHAYRAIMIYEACGARPLPETESMLDRLATARAS